VQTASGHWDGHASRQRITGGFARRRPFIRLSSRRALDIFLDEIVHGDIELDADPVRQHPHDLAANSDLILRIWQFKCHGDRLTVRKLVFGFDKNAEVADIFDLTTKHPIATRESDMFVADPTLAFALGLAAMVIGFELGQYLPLDIERQFQDFSDQALRDLGSLLGVE